MGCSLHKWQKGKMQRKSSKAYLGLLLIKNAQKVVHLFFWKHLKLAQKKHLQRLPKESKDAMSQNAKAHKHQTPKDIMFYSPLTE